MSDTPLTDAATAGCSFGPFVEGLASLARQLERELSRCNENADRAVPSEALLAEAFAKYLKREDKHFMFKATREEVQEAFLAGVAWTLAAPAAGKPLVGHCGIHRVREPDDLISGHLEYETQTLCGEATCSDECWQSWAFCPYCGKPFDVPKQAEPLVIGLPNGELTEAPASAGETGKEEKASGTEARRVAALITPLEDALEECLSVLTEERFTNRKYIAIEKARNVLARRTGERSRDE